MITTKFAKLQPVKGNNDVDRLVRFPAEHHKFHDDSTLLEIKNKLYEDGEDEWSSLNMTNHTRNLIFQYFHQNSKTLEIGCGTGGDSKVLDILNFKVTAIDKSKSAILKAKKETSKISWVVGNFTDAEFQNRFENIYEKGTFHNIISKEDKIKFIKAIASNLRTGGRWFSISGCSDSFNSDKRFGRINFSEFVSLVEPYFMIKAVVRDEYGSIKAGYTFDAWHIILEKR